jgi:hypothetical protein
MQLAEYAALALHQQQSVPKKNRPLHECKRAEA